MENLLCQRFNFFLILFSLVLAGVLSTSSPSLAAPVLALGTLICVLVGATVYRAFIKHDCIMKLLYEDKEHPVTITSAALSNRRFRAFPVGWLIGFWIPFVCCLALLAGAVLVWGGWLKVGRE